MIKRIKITELDENELKKTEIDPSTQIDDFFDYSKAVVKKPWGYEYLMYQNDFVAMWILYIKKSFQTSMHCHPNKKTSLVVLSGEAICSTLHNEIKRTAGEGLLIDNATFHSTKAVSEEGIFIMEIETPVNKRDLIRLKDEYGRVGKGYETRDKISFDLQNYNYVSFIEPEVYYNVKRRFGNCGISFARFKNNPEFKSKFQLNEWEVVCLLKGKILDENKKIIADVGDTIDFEHIKQYENINIENEIETITIKKNDSMVKLSDFVISFLEKEKIKNFFVVPGSTNVHLLDSIGRNNQIQHICNQTEEAATMAAEAHAKLTKKVGVTIISSGSCAIRTLSGVADAWVDSTPLLIIAGQSQSDQIKGETPIRQLGVQELNLVDIVKPITKYAVIINDPKKIKYHLQKAIHLAQAGRPGPVWIDLPIDIQGMNINEDELTSFNPLEIKEPTNTDSLQKNVLETLSLIKEAKRPVILVGNGTKLANAEKDFTNLIEILSIPVLTSKRSADILPDNHPLFFGRPGAYGQRSANLIIQNADLLISIGSRLSIPQIGRNYKAFAREAKKVIVDIDEEELKKKTINPDIAIPCCAKDFIKEIIKNKNNYAQPTISKWIKKCTAWKEKYSSEKIELSEKSVNAYSFIETLSKELKKGAIMTIDGGSPIIFTMQQFKFKENQRLLSATGLENPSFALPAAIGACVGNSGKEIICICEDCGFQKNVQELETIIRYKLPIKIFVLNSKGYSYIRNTQQAYFGGRYVASDNNKEVLTGDIVKIANAYGIPVSNINHYEEIEERIKETLNLSGPIICNINIDKNQQVVPKITFTVKPDGKWIAKPLEDMYPFLDRTEFNENMIIKTEEESND